MDWDRMTDPSPMPTSACDPTATYYYLAMPTGAPDFGTASTGEPRDVSDPDPPCP